MRAAEVVSGGRRLGLAVIALMVAITVSTAVWMAMDGVRQPGGQDWHSVAGTPQLVAWVWLAQVAVAAVSLLVVGPAVVLLPGESQERYWEWMVAGSLVVLPVLLAGVTRGGLGLDVFGGWQGLWLEAVAGVSCGVYLLLLRRARRGVGNGTELGLQVMVVVEVVVFLGYAGLCVFHR